MRILKVIGQLLLALSGAILYWKLSFNLGLPLLLFVVSLAVVGEGNRLLWAAIFPFISCAIAAVIYAGYLAIPAEAELMKLLLTFTMMSVVPGVLLWGAVKLKCARSAVATAKSKVEQTPLSNDAAGSDA